MLAAKWKYLAVSELDRKDLLRIIAGLSAYAGLDARATMERLRLHPEDRTCTLPSYGGRIDVFCTRDGLEAISSLAERLRETLPVPDDHSVDELFQEIIKQIAPALVEEADNESAVSRILGEALAAADAKHICRTYFFPCILFHDAAPARFKVGPIEFATPSEFRRVMQNPIRSYVERDPNPQFAASRVDQFIEHGSEFGWFAKVHVHRCSEQSSRARAELAISTAINLFRLLFGVAHANDIRLAHGPHIRWTQLKYAVETSEGLDIIESRRTPHAFVDKNWIEFVNRNTGFWNHAAHLLDVVTIGKRSDIANRLIDALRWFGEAAYEAEPGGQIIKFVLALERLTRTRLKGERFGGTHQFCSRVAALTSEADDKSFAQRYWEAFMAYDARSEAVHGSASPSSRGFYTHLRPTHELTRKALFQSLQTHCKLDDSGSQSTLIDLHRFYESILAPRAALTLHLKRELKQKLSQASTYQNP